jgi:RNA polymerase sigma-70 factor, ECF subfamily
MSRVGTYKGSEMQRQQNAEPVMLKIEAVTRKSDYIYRGRRKPDAGGIKDESLLRRVTREDDEALSELYDRYGGLIYSMGLKLLGERSLAEDLVQDVFISVWRNARSFDATRASFATWIYRIARNRATDLERKRRARPNVVAADETLIQLPASDGTGDVAASLDVAEAISRLSPEHREVLILAYSRGFSQREIARSTGTSVGTVKRRITAALKAMRSIMLPAREGDDE